MTTKLRETFSFLLGPPPEWASKTICPRCKERGRVANANGSLRSYCKPCANEVAKEWRAKSSRSNRYDGICPICGERERPLTSNGKRRPYCNQCRRERRRKT